MAHTAYQAKGEAAFFSTETRERLMEVLEARIAELECFCEHLSMENAALKTLHLLPQLVN